MSCRPQRGQRSRSHPRWWNPPGFAPQSPQRPLAQRSRANGTPSIVTSESVQPCAVVISKLQSMHVAMPKMMHAGCDSHPQTFIRCSNAARRAGFLHLMRKWEVGERLRRAVGAGYGMCRPLIDRATTNRWISEVLSKIV